MAQHTNSFIVALFMLVTYVCTQQEAEKLEIYPSENPIIKALGESMVITCVVTGLNDPTIDPDLRWYTPDGTYVLDTSGTRYIERAGLHSLKLYFTAIRNIDSGPYRCQGELQGARRDKEARLEIFKDITFDHAPPEQIAAIHTDALLQCEVSGQPMPIVSWRYADNTIVTGGRYIQEQHGLRILNVTEADDDYPYLCRAEIFREGRYEEARINFDVQVPPRMLKPMGIQEGIAEQEGTLTCFATADPSPKYEFFKDGNENKVESDGDIEVVRDSGYINFRPFSEHNAGTYKCRAFNEVGEAFDTGELKVWVRPRIETLLNQTAEEFQSQTIECIAKGNPPPEMTFQKMYLDYSDPPFEMGNNDGGRIIVANPSSGILRMEIRRLTPDDTANYTCLAKNLAGDEKRNGTITVHHTPRFDENHPTEFYLWAGKTRNITCFSQAEPKPAIKWFKGGQELQNNETYKIYPLEKNSNLQIKCEIQDQGWIYGLYTCHADNGIGTGEIVIDVMRASIPGPPSNITILASSPTMVVFRAKPPLNNGGLEVVEYRLEFDNTMRDLPLDEDARIENLNPQTTYIFKVRAKNEVGVGEAYDLIFKTDAIRVPSPLILEPPPTDPEFAYSYELTWQKPETGGLEIDEYEFKIRKVEVGPDGQVTKPQEDWVRSLRVDNPRSPKMSHRFENLSPDSYYEVKVRARNDIGFSLDNTEYVFQTGIDPSYGHVKGNTATETSCNGRYIAAFLLMHCIMGYVPS